MKKGEEGLQVVWGGGGGKIRLLRGATPRDAHKRGGRREANGNGGRGRLSFWWVMGGEPVCVLSVKKKGNV